MHVRVVMTVDVTIEPDLDDDHEAVVRSAIAGAFRLAEEDLGERLDIVGVQNWTIKVDRVA